MQPSSTIFKTTGEVKVQREGVSIKVFFNENEIATLLIDPHDNRITGCDFAKLINFPVKSATIIVSEICKYLQDNFGGKEFILVNSSLVSLFQDNGFSVPAIAKTPEEKEVGPQRTRWVSAANLAAAELHYPSEAKEIASPDLRFTTDKHEFATQPEVLLELAKGSGFTEQKIQDYKNKAKEGMLLAFTDDNNIPFALLNAAGKIVACCRVTKLGNGFGYLGDTFVDINALNVEVPRLAKAIGTYLLYQKVGEYLHTNISTMPQTLLLIDPPTYTYKIGDNTYNLDRVTEFDENYGCQPLCNLEAVSGMVALIKFAGSKPELQNTFSERVAFVTQQATQSMPR